MISNFPIKPILIIWLKLKISMENNKKQITEWKKKNKKVNKKVNHEIKETWTYEKI